MAGNGRQRGKAKQLQETLSEQGSELQEAVVNGKPKMNGSTGIFEQSVEAKENIFLFIPNIIGW